MAGDNQKLTRRRALCLLGAPVIAGATGVGFASPRDPDSEMHGMEHGTPSHDHTREDRIRAPPGGCTGRLIVRR